MTSVMLVQCFTNSIESSLICWAEVFPRNNVIYEVNVQVLSVGCRLKGEVILTLGKLPLYVDTWKIKVTESQQVTMYNTFQAQQ